MVLENEQTVKESRIRETNHQIGIPGERIATTVKEQLDVEKYV